MVSRVSFSNATEEFEINWRNIKCIDVMEYFKVSKQTVKKNCGAKQSRNDWVS